MAKKHTKRCSHYLLLGKFRSKPHETSHHIQQNGYYQIKQTNKHKVTNSGKDMEKLELLCTIRMNVKWHIHYGK